MPITLRVQRVKGAWLECRHDSGIPGENLSRIFKDLARSS